MALESPSASSGEGPFSGCLPPRSGLTRTKDDLPCLCLQWHHADPARAFGGARDPEEEAYAWRAIFGPKALTLIETIVRFDPAHGCACPVHEHVLGGAAHPFGPWIEALRHRIPDAADLKRLPDWQAPPPAELRAAAIEFVEILLSQPHPTKTVAGQGTLAAFKAVAAAAAAAAAAAGHSLGGDAALDLRNPFSGRSAEVTGVPGRFPRAHADLLRRMAAAGGACGQLDGWRLSSTAGHAPYAISSVSVPFGKYDKRPSRHEILDGLVAAEAWVESLDPPAKAFLDVLPSAPEGRLPGDGSVFLAAVRALFEEAARVSSDPEETQS